jgi:hypothetical protein
VAITVQPVGHVPVRGGTRPDNPGTAPAEASLVIQEGNTLGDHSAAFPGLERQSAAPLPPFCMACGMIAARR